MAQKDWRNNFVSIQILFPDNSLYIQNELAGCKEGNVTVLATADVQLTTNIININILINTIIKIVFWGKCQKIYTDKFDKSNINLFNDM